MLGIAQYVKQSSAILLKKIHFSRFSHKDNSKINLTGMAQLVCGGCRTILMYARGAASVRCSCCNTISVTMSGIYYFLHSLFWLLPCEFTYLITWLQAYNVMQLELHFLVICSNNLRYALSFQLWIEISFVRSYMFCEVLIVLH